MMENFEWGKYVSASCQHETGRDRSQWRHRICQYSIQKHFRIWSAHLHFEIRCNFQQYHTFATSSTDTKLYNVRYFE